MTGFTLFRASIGGGFRFQRLCARGFTAGIFGATLRSIHHHNFFRR